MAAHPDLEYGEYQVGDRRLILATARAAALPSSSAKGAPTFAELGAVRTFPGRELAGLRYRRPLEVVPLPEDRASRLVVLGDFVTAEDGSGLVHMAPAFGADDFQAGIEHGLALVRPVAGDGTFVGTSWPEIEGRLVTARETNDLIIQRLKQDGRWHLTQSHTHTYPHCWRCSSPLIYYARDSWFVRTSAVEAADAGAQQRGGVASARGRRGTVRRVAREQRGLGALAGPLLGHAAPGVGVRPRPVARGRGRELRGSRRAVGPGAAARLRPAQAAHRHLHVGGARAAASSTARPR